MITMTICTLSVHDRKSESKDKAASRFAGDPEVRVTYAGTVEMGLSAERRQQMQKMRRTLVQKKGRPSK